MDTQLVKKDPVDESLSFEYIDKCKEWEDFISYGMIAREFKDRSQWVLGRLASKLATTYGEKSLEKYAKDIGVIYPTLRSYKAVVELYYDEPEFLPNPKISFTLYQRVATMPKDERKKFLEQADDNNYSIERAIIERKKLEGKRIKPSFQIIYCEEHRRWMFLPVDSEQWEKFHNAGEVTNG